MLKLSICIIAFNEEKFLPNLLEDMKKQKYSHNLIEIVLIDSVSMDNTLKIMQDFKDNNIEFYAVQVLQNQKNTSCWMEYCC